MKVQMFTVGALFTNCYVTNCEKTKEAIVVDPGFDDHSEAERIFKYIDANALKPRYIVDTHGHPDHVCGNGIVKEKFQTPILIHESDAHMLGESSEDSCQLFGLKNYSPEADAILQDGHVIKFGNATLRVIATPGHSRGGISLLGDHEVFTGDTLFSGSIGRTDFPEGSESDMRRSLKKLALLPDNFVVYPGHGPTTAMGEEKRNNPFLQSL
jgi:hydroxyacylglutathione hydrolase